MRIPCKSDCWMETVHSHDLYCRFLLKSYFTFFPKASTCFSRCCYHNCMMLDMHHCDRTFLVLRSIVKSFSLKAWQIQYTKADRIVVHLNLLIFSLKSMQTFSLAQTYKWLQKNENKIHHYILLLNCCAFCKMEWAKCL